MLVLSRYEFILELLMCIWMTTSSKFIFANSYYFLGLSNSDVKMPSLLALHYIFVSHLNKKTLTCLQKNPNFFLSPFPWRYKQVNCCKFHAQY